MLNYSKNIENFLPSPLNHVLGKFKLECNISESLNLYTLYYDGYIIGEINIRAYGFIDNEINTKFIGFIVKSINNFPKNDFHRHYFPTFDNIGQIIFFKDTYDKNFKLTYIEIYKNALEKLGLVLERKVIVEKHKINGFCFKKQNS